MKALAVSAVVLSVLATGVAFAPADAEASSPLVRKINKVRHKHGLPSLRESRSLDRSSRRFAHQLMRVNRFGHASHILASHRFRRLGEILALQRGWRRRPGAAVRAWLGSPTHRSVMLSRVFNQVGAGVSRGRFGRGLRTILVAQFGRR